MRFLVLLLLCLIANGCASSAKQDYFYNEIVIRNNSTSPVSDVTISIKNRGMLFNCSFIAPRAECSNKFRKQKYQGRPIRIKWTHNYKTNQTQQLNMTLPAHFAPEKMIRGVLEVKNDGTIRPYLEQPTP